MGTSIKVTFTIIVLLALTVGGYMLYSSDNPDADTSTTEDSQTEEQVTQDDTDTQDDKDATDSSSKDIAGDDQEQEQEEESPEGSIVLNNFGQRDDGTVFANATVSGTQEGTCEFRFSRNGARVTKATDIERTPTGYYACGVTANSDQFNPKGTWTAIVVVKQTDPVVKSNPRQTQIE